MSFDSNTQAKLDYQARRMQFALAEGNTREAEVIQRRVDTILDTRPSPIAVAADGEVLYDNQPASVIAQGVAFNVTDEDEAVLTSQQLQDAVMAEACKLLGIDDDPEDGGTVGGGGVGVLDRP